jgi:hypothetical protein
MACCGSSPKGTGIDGDANRRGCVEGLDDHVVVVQVEELSHLTKEQSKEKYTKQSARLKYHISKAHAHPQSGGPNVKQIDGQSQAWCRGER